MRPGIGCGIKVSTSAGTFWEFGIRNIRKDLYICISLGEYSNIPKNI